MYRKRPRDGPQSDTNQSDIDVIEGLRNMNDDEELQGQSARRSDAENLSDKKNIRIFTSRLHGEGTDGDVDT